MSVIGIVCEFNPFHNGHKHLIDSVKQQGDVVVCVMSGNFVQRGEPAIFPKDIRVKAALMNGADIVLELPFVYATASAETFAYNAVKILDSFGCDKIAFGTENANINNLNKIVDVLTDEKFDIELKKCLETGESYPSARQSAFNKFIDNCDISLPNNILAVEYLKAIRKLNSKIQPISVNRIGADYNDDFAVDDFASATHIRSLIFENKSFDKFVPNNIIDLYHNAISTGKILSKDKYNVSSLALLRSKIYEKSENIANMSEGLENRINDAVCNSVSLEEIYDFAKTKRYTHSRIRRAVLCYQFAITNDDLDINVPYCRLLGYNKNCKEIVGNLVGNCKLPFVVRYSDVLKYDNDIINRIYEIENKTTDFFSLVLNNPDVCSKEKTFSPIKE
ncbi:MAG: nucleotidyltransferase family protein [Clostridia bacterium]|nr:nucleotidyltransferase family protein [Clostridia bacterium]